MLDNHSKFGTLKLVSEPIQINSVTHEPVYIQVGRALLCLSSESKHSLYSLLCGCLRLNKMILNDNNSYLNYEEAVLDFP